MAAMTFVTMIMCMTVSLAEFNSQSLYEKETKDAYDD